MTSLFWIPLFLCFHTFLPRKKKSKLMLIFSQENLVHAQCSVFHMRHPRIFDNSDFEIHCHNLIQKRKIETAAHCQVTSSSKIEPLFGDLPAFSKTSCSISPPPYQGGNAIEFISFPRDCELIIYNWCTSKAKVGGILVMIPYWLLHCICKHSFVLESFVQLE